MNSSSKLLALLAAVASFLCVSCASNFYNRSSSKGGMVESGGGQSFNPFAGLIQAQLYVGPPAPPMVVGYGGGGYCPPRPCPPNYGGGYYRQPQRPCPPGYGRPMPRPCPPPNYGGGYGRRPCPPGYGGGYGGYRRPYYGAAGNGIIAGSQAGGMYEFSDQYPGGRRIR